MTTLAVEDDFGVVLLCSRDACPHWQGQAALPTMAAAADMRCALVGYAPSESCQAEYLDRVVEIDAARRAVWERLDEAERLERRRHAAAAIRSAAG
jgi:hypothetical protein